jgi:hypothetical protein
MRKITILALAAVLLFAACSPPPQAAALPPLSLGAWKYADLRWIGPGNAANPQQDLVAAYARSTGDTLQIRLDFLSFYSSRPFDIYLALDNAPGGETHLPVAGNTAVRWNQLLVFPTGSDPLLLSPGQPPQPTRAAHLSVDEDFDGLVIHLEAQFLIPGTTFQVFLTPPGANDIVDATSPLDLTGAPPEPAPLLLAFWDALPAASPAQSMRRWNGAHTGPLGQRHGLFQLLRASEQHNIPLALLDLKNPASLAALELLGGLELLHELDARALLLLPDYAAGDPLTALYSMDLSRRSAQQYGLASSDFFFAPVGADLLAGYQAGFYVSADSRVLAAAGGRLIPLPAPVYPEVEDLPGALPQVDRAGLTLETKRALLEATLSGDPARLAVFGGSLPDSPWADSSITPLAFAYIANHPWIRPLDRAALLSIPLPPARGQPELPCPDLLCTPLVLPFTPYSTTEVPIASGLTLPELRHLIRTDLESAPPGIATDLAWQMYLNLTAPTPDPYCQALQANYLGQVGHLLAIARWAASPAPVSDCAADLDWDGTADCILASDSFIATFKIDGGRLLFAGSLENGEFMQWIGPASQFQVGAGESHDWLIRLGAAADPNEIPGAFAPRRAPFSVETPAIEPGLLTFHSAAGDQKTYQLTPGGIRFSMQSSAPVHTRLPLVLSPQRFWQPGGSTGYSLTPAADQSSFTWGAAPGLQLQVQFSAANARLDSSIESIQWMQTFENPDQAYPAGHFLPFPIAVMNIQSEGAFYLAIDRK